MIRIQKCLSAQFGTLAGTVLALAAFLLLSASGLLAQTDTGVITGTVTDPTGAVIGGAQITAVNTENGLQLNAVANGVGEYNILAVPRGTYKVTGKAAGF